MSKGSKNYTNNKMGADTVIGLIILLVLFAAGAEIMRPGSEWGEAIENRPRTTFDEKCEDLCEAIDNNSLIQRINNYMDDTIRSGSNWYEGE